MRNGSSIKILRPNLTTFLGLVLGLGSSDLMAQTSTRPPGEGATGVGEIDPNCPTRANNTQVAGSSSGTGGAGPTHPEAAPPTAPTRNTPQTPSVPPSAGSAGGRR